MTAMSENGNRASMGHPRGYARSTAVGFALAAVLIGGCDGGAAPAEGSGSPTQSFSAAPESARVDLEKPTFTSPTSITNPLFPVTGRAQTVQLGSEAGDPLRVEITLLPATKTIDWDGQSVQTLVSQFVAYLDGHVVEVATDYFAQADDGSVWYLGEDVDNYEDGVIANHEGTWLAGRDGPGGMIMPAAPRVGDVYRPENIPGLVLEEVTVVSVTETVDGPRGPVPGSVVVQEHLMDNSIEDKIFAPGYGEFRAEVVEEDELVTLAVAVPFDAVPGGLPDPLVALSDGAAAVFTAAGSGDPAGVTTAHTSMTSAWETYRAGDLPDILAEAMDGAMKALSAAVSTAENADVQQAAIDVARAELDLRLRHWPAAQVDLRRLDVWCRQLLLDAQAEESAFVAGDEAALRAVWQRTAHTLDGPARDQIEAGLQELAAAVTADNLADVNTAAIQIRDALTAARANEP